jgi:hypothetical protein
MKPVPVSSVFEKNALSVRGRWGPEGASGQTRSAAVSRGAGAGMEKKKRARVKPKNARRNFCHFTNRQTGVGRFSLCAFGEKSDREDSFSRF